MTSALMASLTNEQTIAWLRGLFTIAWADGDFEPEEQAILLSLMGDELATQTDLKILTTITADELSAALEHPSPLAENFLRTAVMVAVADGTYSFCEDELLYNFANALGYDTKILEALRLTLCVPASGLDSATSGAPPTATLVPAHPDHESKHNLLDPLRDWLDQLDVHDPKVAHFLCRLIPAQCPFERDISLFGRKVVHIPPMCKLNPLYEQLVSLRFRALSYLADECHEDVTPYC